MSRLLIKNKIVKLIRFISIRYWKKKTREKNKHKKAINKIASIDIRLKSLLEQTKSTIHNNNKATFSFLIKIRSFLLILTRKSQVKSSF
jgi:hypothetical protein